jgi:hypothetical protein
MVAISVQAVDRIYGDERFPTIFVSRCTGSALLCFPPRLELGGLP